jgi:hypothetical protein
LTIRVVPIRILPVVPRTAAPCGIRINKPLKLPPPKLGMILLIVAVPVSTTMSVLTLIVAADANLLSVSFVVDPGIILSLFPHHHLKEIGGC